MSETPHSTTWKRWYLLANREGNILLRQFYQPIELNHFLNRIYRFFCCLYVAWHRFVAKYIIQKAFALHLFFTLTPTMAVAGRTHI